ncbi:MAG: ATP-dependent Clp protease adaptor ClpS [Dehalococcoidia bacterium]
MSTQAERTTVLDEEVTLAPQWHVVLLDDNDHSYDYVIHLLGAVFGYGPEKSFALARIVDTEGRVIVFTGTQEKALEYQEKIHTFGADPLIPRCKGSMSAIVEPAA